MADGSDRDRLAAFLDEERADEAVRARGRERWARQVATEAATFAATMVDLAEQHERVTLTTAAGRTHQGELRAVGADFLHLETAAGAQVYVRTDAVAAVRPAHGIRRGEAAGERDTTTAATLHEVLALAVGDRPRVHVHSGAAEPLGGELRAVGDDVLSLRLDEARATVYVRLAAVTAVALVG